MNRLVNGNNNYFYASVVGGQGLTSDQVSDTGTGHTLSYDINYLKNNIGGASLTGDITIGTNFSNTISVNSGSTTYNNAEIIKVKDNAMASIRLQCNDAGPTDLMILNTTNGAESMYLPLQYTEIGNVENGGVQIGDGSNAGATNLYGIVSLKNATDSTTYSSTNCSNVAGGLSVYKKLNVGGSINAVGSINGGAITSTGNINAYGNTIYGGAIIATGAISGTTITGTGALSVGANSITCGAITSSGAISCGTLSPQNILLPTSGGTATALNYYEEYSYSATWTCYTGGATIATVTHTIVRVGKLVTMRIPLFSGNCNGSFPFVSTTYAMPTRFRPLVSSYYNVQVANTNGTIGITQSFCGQLAVLNTGVLSLVLTGGGTGVFGTGLGSGLPQDVHISWILL
jgi:hypothetical protein